VLAVTNVMGSQATRDADGVLFTRAGLEIGVAATKTFVAQVAAMYLLGLRLAELRGTLDPSAPRELRRRLKRLPHCVERAARPRRGAVAAIARRTVAASSSSTSGRTSGSRRARGRAQAQGDLLHRRPTPTRRAR
jgi:glucosamine--fructose-6-phosphate aminotransferase (isomerizing)